MSSSEPPKQQRSTSFDEPDSDPVPLPSFDSVVQPSAEQPQSDKDPISSPDEAIKRDREILEEKHRHAMKMLKQKNLLILILRPLGAIFILVLVLFFLPITQMGDEYSNAWDFARSWANAFVYTWSSFWLTISAILVSEALKAIYRWIKKSIEESNES